MARPQAVVPAAGPSKVDRGAEPILAPPGAGVPRIERLVGWVRLAIASRQGAAVASKLMRSEQAAIHRVVEHLPLPEAGARVLIPRLRGLEDSSRWWSVWMTLDHLRIVNESIAGVISVLGTERAPTGEASTAAVKPSPDAGPAVLAALDASCDAIERSVAALPRPKSMERFPHPWFGPLDTAGWHAMAAMHMGIHLAQLRAIVRGLELRTAGRG